MHRLALLSAEERQRIIDEFVEATSAGLDPGSPGGGLAAAMRALPADLPAEPQPYDPALAARRPGGPAVETFTDRRVERYWQLVGQLNGREPFRPAVPAFEWLIAALRSAPAT
jgi:hypothetical protein